MIVNNPSAPDIDVVAVTEAIEKVFQTLDPWFEAKSDVSDIDDIIQCIRLQGRNYAVVVDLSVKTSEDGVVLANQALLLCSEIMGGRDEITTEGFFAGILLTAATAYERAEKCRDLFQKIRSNIAIISTRVPKATKRTTKKLASVKVSMSRNELASQVFGSIAEAASDPAPSTEGSSTYGLISPFAIVRFFARGAGSVFAANLEKHKREHSTLEDALINLERLDQDFKCIHNCLGHLAEWWRGIKEKLSDMEQKIQHRGISTYKDEAVLDALRGGWNDVKERYQMYQSKTTEIQDRYRSRHRTKSEEMDIGFKGRLLDLQRSADALYDGLTLIEDGLTTTLSGRNKKVRQSIHTMRETFLAQLIPLLDCLQKLEKGTEESALNRMLGYHHTMHKTLQNLLNESNTCSRILSVELWILWRIVDKERPQTTRGILGTMKLRTGGSNIMQPVEQLEQIEKAIQGILSFGIDLALSGPWKEGDTVVRSKFQSSVRNTVHAIEYLKEKLEEKLKEAHSS